MVASGDLSVGQVALRSGISVSTLHFYEAQGLIQAWRSKGNQRRYPRQILRRIAIIKVAQRVGIPLAEIQAALQALPASRTPTAADWAQLSLTWRAELDARIQRLTELRDQLSDCIGCGCLSIDACRLRNPQDVLGEIGPGPRLLHSDASATMRS